VTRNALFGCILAAMLAPGIAACGGDKPEARDDDDRDAVPSADAAATGTPAATGTVIEIKAITDDRGNRFEPTEIEAKPGDILRVTLVSGVHNINFLADSNPGKSGLPAPSELLQLPGQTHDVPLTFGAGHYYFQCDPHAALGMVGSLEIEDDD
jgi:plastocyanin